MTQIVLHCGQHSARLRSLMLARLELCEMRQGTWHEEVEGWWTAQMVDLSFDIADLLWFVGWDDPEREEQRRMQERADRGQLPPLGGMGVKR